MRELWLTSPITKIALFPAPKTCPLPTKLQWIISYRMIFPTLYIERGGRPSQPWSEKTAS
ncbi:unknown protein [Microcystis aeruginosa NIES-843]|uniref:Uncharacterized protein n=1 Tax=Microcystis aeruginosa (strain NIES-843 / IAM M-2473) TaxID=449447 RepID=B0JIP7_MICAN|nr:unknown protein [Microcystis aeruginosa NIES-843]